MKYYYHRLLRLFSCLEPPNFIELLFGPFARFYHEAGMAKCSVSSQTFATGMTPHLIQQAALCRMHEIWILYQKHKGCMSEDAAFSYVIGTVMDTHLPVATITGKVSISDVYLRKLAPEQITVDMIWCDEGFPNKTVILEQLWSTQFGSNVVITSNETTQKSKSKKHSKQPINFSESLITQMPTGTPVTLCSADEKLLRKGLPNPTSSKCTCVLF